VTVLHVWMTERWARVKMGVQGWEAKVATSSMTLG
jgi:hypothetical protein